MRSHLFVAAMLGAAALTATPAGAQQASSREYFVAHTQGLGAPSQLSRGDAEYYRDVFEAIDREEWSRAQQLLDQRRDGLLYTVAQAQLYLAARSPRVELHQIQAWLERGRNLPMAAQLGRLGVTRGAAAMPDLPAERRFRALASIPKRIRPAATRDGTMPESVSSEILSRISNDDSLGAHQLLYSVDAQLSPAARAEWRQRVAWSYYIENHDRAALDLARSVSEGEGPWVAEGEWVAGLAAWRLSDCRDAWEAFDRAGRAAYNVELRAAAFYWASRAAIRCRNPERAADLLRFAAQNDETLYGMLAAEQLGMALPANHSSADFSSADWRELGGIENVRVAIALAQIARDELSSEVLLHQARIGDPAHYAALSRLARGLGLPATQMYMAHNAPAGGEPDPATRYPSPKWVPIAGWRIDPALAYAHALQESNFRAGAVSPADARGLMQIRPIAAREYGPAINLSANSDLMNPAVNIAFGQQALLSLATSSATQGALPKVMAAYNAGLTPVTRWNYEIRDFGDPLLWMESIPYWETRGYVAIVMRNYWMYERQANSASPSRISLSQNKWPGFPGTGGGRVYLTAERSD